MTKEEMMKFKRSFDFQTQGDNITVKLADFGESKELGAEDLTRTCVGTPLVMAPEQLLKQKYGHQAEIWSLGCVLFKLLTRRYPFNAETFNELIDEHEKGNYTFPAGQSISLDGLRFLQSCLQHEPSSRPTWDELF